MKKEVWKKRTENKEVVTRKEHHWFAAFGEWEVYLSFPDPDSNGVCSSQPRLEVRPTFDTNRADSIGRGFSVSPRSVSELETLATNLPAILSAVVEALKAEGIEDLRTKWEREMDASMTKLRKQLTKERA